jgi:hypothetical protein
MMVRIRVRRERDRRDADATAGAAHRDQGAELEWQRFGSAKDGIFTPIKTTKTGGRT